MKLKDLMEVLEDGTAVITIEGICEEYGYGVEELKTEPEYLANMERKVAKVMVIGGGCDDPELYIVLGDEE